MKESPSKPYKIQYYNKVKAKAVKWLWYPYIPYGKITIIQGDPGDGKSTLALNLLALVTNGGVLPLSSKKIEQGTVIYQNNEDGKEDTIVPRMKACGADLSKVAYIDETEDMLSMGDERIEQVLDETKARLIILDPIQAYLGDTDMNRASEIRPVFRRLAAIAQKRSCAVVLIGHMSKGGGKGLYRGLGSIDIAAVARSVLLVSKVREDLRIIAPIKNNLAPMGDSILFRIDGNSKINWIGYPKRVRLLINPEKKEIVLQPCNEFEKLAFKVPNDFGDNTHGFELSSISLTELLIDTMNWTRDVHYRVCGRYIEKENIIVFPLTEYETVTGEESEENDC